MYSRSAQARFRWSKPWSVWFLLRNELNLRARFVGSSRSLELDLRTSDVQAVSSIEGDHDVWKIGLVRKTSSLWTRDWNDAMDVVCSALSSNTAERRGNIHSSKMWGFKAIPFPSRQQKITFYYYYYCTDFRHWNSSTIHSATYWCVIMRSRMKKKYIRFI